jgi:NAD-dependent deacetylase
MAKVVFLSSIGISSESGIKMFKSNNGLWNDCMVYDVSTNYYKTTKLKDKPNYIHQVVTHLKEKFPDDIAVITQSNDNMYEKAGCKDVLHLPDFMRSVMCMHKSCKYKKPVSSTNMYINAKCPKCGGSLCTDMLSLTNTPPIYKKIAKQIDKCEMLVLVGISGTFLLPIDFMMRKNMKMNILNTLNDLNNSDKINNKLFTKTVCESAFKAIDEVSSEIEKILLNCYETTSI